ncbi:MAG: hypothetical protein ABJC89_10075 [Acidobacteriota bacterium]
MGIGFRGLWIAVALSIVPAGGRYVPGLGGGTAGVLGSAAAKRTTIGDSRLQTQGVHFLRDGQPFDWRGISAFRIVEMEAHGRHAEVARYLDWAAARHVTVIRVFSMARHLFDLSPADGLTALPKVLEQAGARQIHVEIVALVDTRAIQVDLEAHVKAIGAIAAAHPNAIVEIANEPAHPTQRHEIHDPRVLQRLRTLIPEVVPVAFGSAEEDGAYSGGSFATMHFPRAGGPSGWRHVLTLAEGAGLSRKWGKPVVNDEPIGAADQLIPGRRDNAPARFRAAGLVTRLAGMGGTFHYEGGLQARIPAGRELECFEAWNSAWDLLDPGVERQGVFSAAGEPGAAVMSYSREHAAGVFERRSDAAAWVLAVDVAADPSIRWRPGWKEVSVRRLEGVWLLTARRAVK